MRKPLNATYIQGIDVVINRYAYCLDTAFPEWTIYPRLERFDDKWKYYTGKRREHEEVNFAEKNNVVGFGVSNTSHLGNQNQCTLTVMVGIKLDTENLRDVSYWMDEVQKVLKCCYQTTKCDIESITPSEEDRSKQPFMYFDVEITANYVPSYKQYIYEYNVFGENNIVAIDSNNVALVLEY